MTDTHPSPPPTNRPSFDVVVVVGNPSPGGRTTRVGQAVANALVDSVRSGERRPGDPAPFETIELADLAHCLFEWGNQEVAALAARVAEADIVVVASPTSKATYTGLLKAFLDSYDDAGLTGCRAVPVMVGADPRHALAVEVHLRPLLVELGATVPSRGLYVLQSEVDDLDAVVTAWAGDAVPLVLAGTARS